MCRTLAGDRKRFRSEQVHLAVQSDVTDPISLDLVLSGRDLTEPRLSPDGQSVAFVHRSGSSAAISVVAADGSGPERIVTFAAEPGAGSGVGWWLLRLVAVRRPASCICGRDGEICGKSTVPSAASDRSRTIGSRAPAVAGDGSFVVHVVDEAEVWLVARSDRRADPARRRSTRLLLRPGDLP